MHDSKHLKDKKPVGVQLYNKILDACFGARYALLPQVLYSFIMPSNTISSEKLEHVN
jgi:hypothetical protein